MQPDSYEKEGDKEAKQVCDNLIQLVERYRNDGEFMHEKLKEDTEQIDKELFAIVMKMQGVKCAKTLEFMMMLMYSFTKMRTVAGPKN